jgi:two-component system nitrogen regulation response regulator NtrX
VPPLRKRAEDIPQLIRHFVERFARENNFKPKRFTTGAVEALSRLHWRGNVRELRNSVERLLVMTSGQDIDLSEAQSVLRIDGRSVVTGDVAGNARTLREFKEASERAFLVGKLREQGWNISKTAEEIDTPRSNLYKKLEQYNISQEADG